MIPNVPGPDAASRSRRRASGALIAQRALDRRRRPWPRRRRRVADLRARSWRHALLAADADHARQRAPAAAAWVYHMKPPAAAGHARGPPRPLRRRPGPRRQGRPGRTRRRAGGFASGETTPLVIDGVMYMSDAIRPRGGARSGHGQGEVGLPAALRQSVDARRRVLAGDAQNAAADRLRLERRQALFARREDRRAQRGVRRQGVVDLNTPEILQGLPGNNGLSSPPIVYKHLIITGGRTQEGPAQGPAGDVRAWDVHTGKLVWTFHSVPRPASRSTTRGRATAGRTARASTSGA